MSVLKWFASRRVRHALAMCKHVRKIFNHQRDILTAKAIEEVEASMRAVKEAAAGGVDKATLEKLLDGLEKTANKWLKPYPHSAWRENVEVLLVALAVAMGIRTFFLQPFKIPTGSMQPTLYGVTSRNLKDDPDFKIPAGWARVKEWFQGVSYIHKVARVDGELKGIGEPFGPPFLKFYQRFVFAGKSHTIWFPPDYGNDPLGVRAGLRAGQFFRKGEDIVKLQVRAGDHLFVDRLSYNFRPPNRGEIIVFETKGIRQLQQDQFYIKRLVALPGELVQICDDRHLIIDGRRLDASVPHFENVYSFNTNDPPHPADYSNRRYSGHVNQKYLPMGAQRSLFEDESTVYTVHPGHLMVMGDNTMNSADSRYWGDFPTTNVIGRACFVYWPITRRFGVSCLIQ